MPITIVCIVLALIALAGYLRPASTQEMPVRLLFDNKGGDVVFSHSKHAEGYGISCEQCHHESDQPSPTPVPCGTCHPAEYDAAFIEGHQAEIDGQYCNRCHHAEMGSLIFDHQGHIDSYARGCTDCDHVTVIDPEPQHCAICHLPEGVEAMPGLRAASHTRCETCHTAEFGQGMEGCGYCHKFLSGEELTGSYQSCASCHFKAEGPLLPTSMDAYHQGCMGCHEDVNAGPFGSEACKRCHTR